MKGKKTFLIGMIFGLLLSGTIGFFYLLLAGTQEKVDHQQMDHLDAEMPASDKHALMILLANTLARAEADIQADPDGQLSQGLILRIAALNRPLQTYTYLEEDSISSKKLSQERGQLLQALAFMGMDSTSFEQIKSQTSFSGSELRQADLRGVNLDRIDLRGVNLAEANLQGIHLNQADLRDAYVWGANMRETQLEGADLRRSSLSWVDLTGANLSGAAVDGVSLSNTKLRDANLVGASIQWTDGRGAWFNGANLAGVDFLATDLRRANLSKANLCETNLTRTDLREANLTGAELTHAAIQEDNWLELLEEWQVRGAADIQASYRMVKDTTGLSRYRLEKIHPY